MDLKLSLHNGGNLNLLRPDQGLEWELVRISSQVRQLIYWRQFQRGKLCPGHGRALSYPNGAADNEAFLGVSTNAPEANNFTSTGSFSLGSSLSWSLNASPNSVNVTYNFTVSANTSSPVITPLASPTVSWGATPPATVYPGTGLNWSANAWDPNGVPLAQCNFTSTSRRTEALMPLKHTSGRQTLMRTASLRAA